MDVATISSITNFLETPFKFQLFCSGLATFGRTVLKVSPFGKLQAARAESKPSNVTGTLFTYVKDRVPVMVAQVFIIGFLLFALHLPIWSYLVLWIAPIYFFVFLPDEIRAFCEHSVLADPVLEEHRLITFVPPLYEQLYFSPHNMNLHAEHHLWPRIPHYNLPKVRAALADQQAIKVRKSYLVFLGEVIHYLKQTQRQQSPKQQSKERNA
jgi:fatty acid desaturase